jgi:hypothetical protein
MCEHEFVRLHRPAIVATFMAGVMLNDPDSAAHIHRYICTKGAVYPWIREYVAALWSWSVSVVRANLFVPQ